MTRHIVAAVALLTALSTSLSFAQTARLELQSEPGDPIGRGGTYDLTYNGPPGGSTGSYAEAQILKRCPTGGRRC